MNFSRAANPNVTRTGLQTGKADSAVLLRACKAKPECIHASDCFCPLPQHSYQKVFRCQGVPKVLFHFARTVRRSDG